MAGSYKPMETRETYEISVQFLSEDGKREFNKTFNVSITYDAKGKIDDWRVVGVPAPPRFGDEATREGTLADFVNILRVMHKLEELLREKGDLPGREYDGSLGIGRPRALPEEV